MTREYLITVYQDTKLKSQLFDVPKSEKIKNSTWKYKDPIGSGNIIVEPLDTVSAIAKYVSEGKTAVLNMANAKIKGGGVKKGSMAQEECLFRCSNLFTIPDELYPIAIDELIYTHQATFIKNSDYETIWPMEVDVITIAAPNLNKDHKGNESDEYLDNEYYLKVMKDKISAMLSAAAENECVNIILGAWGCGAFKNDPNIVAKLFLDELHTERWQFTKVIFAVINDRNSVANNYQIFHDTFKENA